MTGKELGRLQGKTKPFYLNGSEDLAVDISPVCRTFFCKNIDTSVKVTLPFFMGKLSTGRKIIVVLANAQISLGIGLDLWSDMAARFTFGLTTGQGTQHVALHSQLFSPLLKKGNAK